MLAKIIFFFLLLLPFLITFIFLSNNKEIVAKYKTRRFAVLPFLGITLNAFFTIGLLSRLNLLNILLNSSKSSMGNKILEVDPLLFTSLIIFEALSFYFYIFSHMIKSPADWVIITRLSFVVANILCLSCFALVLLYSFLR